MSSNWISFLKTLFEKDWDWWSVIEDEDWEDLQDRREKNDWSII